MDKRVIARNLKRWRQMQGISQQDVAGRLGVTPAAYSHWENGRTELRVADLVRIAFALAMPLGTLMRALELPIEDRVLSPGQWLDAGRPGPQPLGNPPLNRRAAAPLGTVATALTRQARGAGGGVIQSKVAPRPRELALAYG